MVKITTIRPGITKLPMGHYRRGYNGSPIVHNRFLDEGMARRAEKRLPERTGNTVPGVGTVPTVHEYPSEQTRNTTFNSGCTVPGALVLL